MYKPTIVPSRAAASSTDGKKLLQVGAVVGILPTILPAPPHPSAASRARPYAQKKSLGTGKWQHSKYTVSSSLFLGEVNSNDKTTVVVVVVVVISIMG